MIVKNLEVTANTWGGVIVAASGQYTVVSDKEWDDMAGDANLHTAIYADEAQINDGINDISGHLAQVLYLLQKPPVSPFPAGAFEKRKAGSVAAYSNVTLDYVPASGKVLSIHEMGGSGANSPDIKVEIIWDADGTPETLFVTHGSTSESSLVQKTGDATKIMRVKLTNDSAQSETVEAYWIGSES